MCTAFLLIFKKCGSTSSLLISINYAHEYININWVLHFFFFFLTNSYQHFIAKHTNWIHTEKLLTAATFHSYEMLTSLSHIDI